MKHADYQLRLVGVVRSPLTSVEGCPKQGFEGAPEAWIEIDPTFSAALDGLSAGQEILILTWLHKGNRDLLRVHPRGDPEAPLKGVFATRSPDRPNPIGLHRVEVLEIQRPGRVRVRPLEALNGKPVIDIKPALMSER